MMVTDKSREYRGKGNPNYRHGGYCNYLMSIEEEEAFKETYRDYIKQYPRLLEPACRDVLKRAIILKIRIQRLDHYIEDLTLSQAEREAAIKLQDRLVATWIKLLMRLGLLYTAQQYIDKEKRSKVLTPDELLELRRAKKKKKKKKKEKEVETE